MNRDLYALNDVDPSKGAFKIERVKAHDWNQKGFGVFWTVNEFAGRRIKANLKQLLSWYVEIDEGTKANQLSLVEASPVLPNLMVESKNGFHLYFNVRDASLSNYQDVLARLRHFFNGDERAKDVTRLLRAPGFNHLKNPNEPFPVQAVWTLEGSYSEKLMMYNFAPIAEQAKDVTAYAKREIKAYGDSFWEKVYSLNCTEGLKRLSGSRYVNGEIYTFHPTSNGKLNIWVNGKSSSCWIDETGRIGSSNKGGPTISRWLRYFGHSYKEVYQIIREVFPECL